MNDVFSKRILHLIEEINAIKLGPFTKDEKSFNRVELNDSDKKSYINKIKKYFNQDLDNTFFYLGNLYFIPDYYEGDPKVGTADEEHKYKLLDEFFIQLNVYEKMFTIKKFLSNYYCVPLVLKNDGLVSDKDIRVRLKIPEEVKVLMPHKIQLFSTDIIKYFDSIIMLFNLYLRQNSNYIVSEHYWHEQKGAETILTNFHDDDKDELLSKFGEFLEGYFDFKVFNGKGFKVLEFKFSNGLNAGENVAFKSFLLVHSSESFEIQYEITSLHSAGKLKGNLNYDIPSSLPFIDSILTNLDFPFKIDFTDFFKLDGTDPFGIDGIDPFGIDGTDPFGIDGTDPFGIDGTDPFEMDGTDPFEIDDVDIDEKK
nr:hypothetical protein [Neobacillus sp. Marseille-Q6967]